MGRTYFRKAKDFHRTVKPPNDPRLSGALCDACPLRNSQPVWGDGDVERTMAIVGEAPGKEEVHVGVPFIGRSGQYVENVLAIHQMTRNEVWLDNAVLCFPDGGDMKAFLQRAKKAHDKAQEKLPADKQTDFKSPIDCCRPRLFRWLGIPRCTTCGLWAKVPKGPLRCTCAPTKRKWVTVKSVVQPKVILTLGNSALEALTGHGGIKSKQLYTLGGEE